MRRASLTTIALAIAVTAGSAPAAFAHPALFGPGGAHVPFSGTQHAVCSAAAPGDGACLSRWLQPTGTPASVVSSPTGLPPSTIEGVYGFSSSQTVGTGETVALVDAY